MLTLKHITERSRDLARINQLYVQSFPANERRPLDALLQDSTGSSDFLAFYHEETFVGFACLLTWQDLSHILYFAIDAPLRGRGYGSEALAALRALKPNHRILADLEAQDPSASNNEQRKKRRRFYLRNGYAASEVRYRWREESYEILVCGGTVTSPEFEAFWRHFEESDGNLGQY